MGGFATHEPYFDKYPCFFEDPDFAAMMYEIETLDPLETGDWDLSTKLIDFNCYMSGGRIEGGEEEAFNCVHDADSPCNFVYCDANGDE